MIYLINYTGNWENTLEDIGIKNVTKFAYIPWLCIAYM